MLREWTDREIKRVLGGFRSYTTLRELQQHWRLNRGAGVIKGQAQHWRRGKTMHDLLWALLMGPSKDTLVVTHNTQKTHANFVPSGGPCSDGVMCLRSDNSMLRPDRNTSLLVKPYLVFIICRYMYMYIYIFFYFVILRGFFPYKIIVYGIVFDTSIILCFGDMSVWCN